MSALSSDFDYWDLDAPIVQMAAGGDFDYWDLDAPVITSDTSTATANARRRAAEF